MKKLKPIQLFHLLLFGLFTIGMVGCGGDVASTVDSAIDKASEAVDKAGEAVDKAGEAVNSAVDKATSLADQTIHVFDRSENYLDFAHFGHYDLAHYELKDSKDETAGDAETKTEIYVSESDHMSIEISETNMGERGYTHTQTIKDDEGKVIKKRIFSFETEPQLKLVEEIHDIEAGHLWSREEKMDEHYMKSNKKPEIISHTVAFKDSPI